MAITINGSGTITGVSTGGLPDGSVDADTLATDSVTAAKLKSDAITQGDLPAGSVLQVITDVHTRSATIEPNSTSYIDTGLGAWSITPIRENSKILIQTHGYAMHVNPGSPGNRGGACKYYFQVAGGGYSAASSYWIDGLYQNGGGWTDTAGHSSWIHSPSYTLGQQIDYKMYARKATINGSNQWYFHHSGGIQGQKDGTSNIVTFIMEIAG